MTATRKASKGSERIFTPPEATNTGPGFNRGSGGGARGCGFEERVGAYARTEGGHFLLPTNNTKMAVGLSIKLRIFSILAACIF